MKHMSCIVRSTVYQQSSAHPPTCCTPPPPLRAGRKLKQTDAVCCLFGKNNNPPACSQQNVSSPDARNTSQTGLVNVNGVSAGARLPAGTAFQVEMPLPSTRRWHEEEHTVHTSAPLQDAWCSVLPRHPDPAC